MELLSKNTHSILDLLGFFNSREEGGGKEGGKGAAIAWNHLAGPRTSRLSFLRGFKLGWRTAELAYHSVGFSCAQTEALRILENSTRYPAGSR